ncbi:MAG TPA: cupin domain-containing protein [Candidatus Acidoferrum sp.]
MSAQPSQTQARSDLPPGESVRLAELVNCQEGAVVSRTLLKRPTGTVTVFAFDAEQGLSEHTSPFDALLQVLEGHAEITIAGKPLSTSAGECVLLPANQPHAVKATAPFKMLLTMIRS